MTKSSQQDSALIRNLKKNKKLLLTIAEFVMPCNQSPPNERKKHKEIWKLHVYSSREGNHHGNSGTDNQKVPLSPNERYNSEGKWLLDKYLI